MQTLNSQLTLLYYSQLGAMHNMNDDNGNDRDELRIFKVAMLLLLLL